VTKRKVTVVGAGRIGVTTAQLIFMEGLADLVLLNRTGWRAQGRVLDINHGAALMGVDRSIVGTADIEATRGSDVVIITAGAPRRDGLTRADLLQTNGAIVSSWARQVAEHSPDAVIIVVTNPLDAMVYAAQQASGLPHARVLGMAGVLDASRFATLIARQLGVSVKNVEAVVLGGHGESMVPSRRYTTVAGVPVEQLLPPEVLEALIERTRHAGSDVLALTTDEPAYFSAALSIVRMARAILLDQPLVVCAAAWCQGQYGLNDVYVGVPVRLGRQGVAQVLEYALPSEEQRGLAQSAAEVAELCRALDQGPQA
jgi:malate dehydrogenase